MGLFGGGGSTDISGATGAIQQGTQQGIDAIRQYYGEAVPALKEYFAQGQAQMSPYSVAGSNALDELYDTLGVARPSGGSYGLQSALGNESALSKLVNGTPRQNGWLDPASFTDRTNDDINYLYQQGGDEWTHNPNTYAFNPDTGQVMNNWNANNANDDYAAKLGLKAVYDDATHQYKLESLAQDPTALTPEQQAQWDMIQQYRNGTLAMTDPNAQMNSVLQKLYNSPGYQFTLQQGLQGVDRSAAAKGLINNGAAVKGATNYASGLAQQTYNNRVQQLAGAAGMGQQAAGTSAGLNAQLGTGLANAALGTGSNIASLYGSQAQGLAQLYAGQMAANAQQNSAGMSGLFSLGGSLLGMFG